MMSLNMLIEFGDAFDFTGSDFAGWCREVGFRDVEILPLDRSGERRHRLQVTQRILLLDEAGSCQGMRCVRDAHLRWRAGVSASSVD